MFDSILKPKDLPRRRFGAGTVVSVAVHVGVIAVAVWVSSRPVEKDEQEVAVTFVKPPPPPPPAAPPAPVPKQNRPPPPKKQSEPATVLQQAIVAPKEIPTDKPVEHEPVKDDTKSVGEGGVSDLANVVGGIHGPVVENRFHRRGTDCNRLRHRISVI